MRESVSAWLLLAIIIGVGIFIRANAVSEPMWLDECHTAWVVDTDSVTVVANRAADGNQPPLYFATVWSLTQLTELSEFSLRLVSLIAGSLLMIVASFWAKHLTNRWSAAVLVAGLIAFDGQFIFYASEARSYALVQLIGLMQAIFFWNAINHEYLSGQIDPSIKPSESTATPNSIPWLIGCTLLSIMILLCHYTSIWLLAAEALLFVVATVARKRVSLKLLIAGTTIIAATLGVWSNVSSVFSRRSNWDSVSSIETLWTDLEPWLVHWMLIPIGFAIAGWLWSIAQSRQSEDKDASNAWLLWTWVTFWALLGPIGIATADWLEVAPMALVRYSAVCWVAVAIFASLSLKQFSSTTSWVIAAVILCSSFFGNWFVQDTIAARSQPPFRSEDWVTPMEQIAASNSKEPIFQFADVIEDIDALSETDDRFQQYLRFPILGADALRRSEPRVADVQSITPMPTWNLQFTNEQLDSIRDAKGCWMIFRGNFDYALIIPKELERFLNQPIEFKFIPNDRMPDSRVHLIRVRLK
jgi:hypothetical protein